MSQLPNQYAVEAVSRTPWLCVYIFDLKGIQRVFPSRSMVRIKFSSERIFCTQESCTRISWGGGGGGAEEQFGAKNYYLTKFFAENCMKWKEIGPSWGMGGRGGHPTDKHQKVTHLSMKTIL